ncbi:MULTISPECIES: helix-turn-helix domain-containing protein [unclassified Lebetimonas]|uniref:helix-turn-helix domain-containing protein n=1 Tax=unclassified Lebetimonas TaxID=2648158 RepID=UPI0004657051|nr:MULTISPECIES: helix-turn-helix transcriptional regulator [unclassified Lebetimonas]
MILSDLGKIIKKLRKEKNLSQEELAKKANISRATLSKLENGNLTKISVATFDKILGILGYTIDIKPKNPFVKR